MEIFSAEASVDLVKVLVQVLYSQSILVSPDVWLAIRFKTTGCTRVSLPRILVYIC